MLNRQGDRSALERCLEKMLVVGAITNKNSKLTIIESNKVLLFDCTRCHILSQLTSYYYFQLHSSFESEHQCSLFWMRQCVCVCVCVCL